jgi:hypothetical protein
MICNNVIVQNAIVNNFIVISFHVHCPSYRTYRTAYYRNSTLLSRTSNYSAIYQKEANTAYAWMVVTIARSVINGNPGTTALKCVHTLHLTWLVSVQRLSGSGDRHLIFFYYQVLVLKILNMIVLLIKMSSA